MILAGKKFNVDNISEKGFIAGILNSITEGTEFKKIKSTRKAPILTRKLLILNEIVHTIIRSDNYPPAKEFYYSGALEDLEVAETSWKDDCYWENKVPLPLPLQARHHQQQQGAGLQGEGGTLCQDRWDLQKME